MHRTRTSFFSDRPFTLNGTIVDLPAGEYGLDIWNVEINVAGHLLPRSVEAFLHVSVGGRWRLIPVNIGSLIAKDQGGEISYVLRQS